MSPFDMASSRKAQDCGLVFIEAEEAVHALPPSPSHTVHLVESVPHFAQR
jgi:hypothetical protein